jgi:hypothetical protein
MIDKKGIDPEYIRDEVDEAITCGWEFFDLDDYIDNCDNLNAREKIWAKKHLGVCIAVEIH